MDVITVGTTVLSVSNYLLYILREKYFSIKKITGFSVKTKRQIPVFVLLAMRGSETDAHQCCHGVWRRVQEDQGQLENIVLLSAQPVPPGGGTTTTAATST